MTDQQTLARFDAAVATLQDSRPASLVELAQAAIAADDAMAAYCRPENVDLDEDVLGELEEAQFQTREALYDALAQLGIDRELAGRMGGVLL